MSRSTTCRSSAGKLLAEIVSDVRLALERRHGSPKRVESILLAAGTGPGGGRSQRRNDGKGTNEQGHA